MRVLCFLTAVTTGLILTCVQAEAQTCPTGFEEASAASTLHGILTYHDELREWLGLKLDKPTCGEDEIELVFLEPKHWREAEARRECAVTVIGRLFYSPTGYYSADMAVTDPMVAPDVNCRPFPVKPDPSLAPRKANVATFVAEIVVDYRGKGRVRVRVWEDEHRKSELTPWQPYVHYMLTGSQDVMWFGCADGFDITRISQEPKPKDALFQDEPDLAGTVLPSQTVNVVSFACTRQKDDKPAP